MSIQDFAGHSRILFAMTADFANAVPDSRWDFTPAAPGVGPTRGAGRVGDGFGSFSRQLRHVVNVRGVYNDALARGAVDWDTLYAHYSGSLDRDALMEGLAVQQTRLLERLAEVEPTISIDWGGFPYSIDLFAGEFVQHEAIHHGQWSLYAALGDFEVPASWRDSWGL